jgi:hypothetical protein
MASGTSEADLYISEFNDNVALLAQQTRSRLRSAMNNGTHKGKQASPVDQVDLTSVQQRTGRNQPKVLTAINNERRWVLPKSYSTHTAFDDFDRIRMNVQLDSPYLKAEMNAMNRQLDDDIVDQFFATSVIGEEAGSTVTFANDGGNTVAVGTTDLTVAKLLEGQQKLYESEIDLDNPEEKIWCAITPHQQTTLLNEEKIVNADFVRSETVFDKMGLLTNWFGINFIVTNRLLDTNGNRATENPGASAVREIPMWASSGMHFGVWDDVRGKIVQRLDLDDDPNEMSVYGTFGATRLEGAKVVKIICDET